MKKLLITILLLLCPITAYANKDIVTVTRVIDGDTIEVIRCIEAANPPTKYKVRLIGIDTPETKHPKKGVEPFGKEAFEFTKKQLEGKTVFLEYDAGQRDRYKRLLAYVWLKQDETDPRKMFNSKLLLNGYAQLMTIQPNVKYVEYFTKYQAEARNNKKGLWSDISGRK